MKKLLIVFVMFFVLILAACGTGTKFGKTIQLDDELKFIGFNIKMNKVKVFEKNNKKYATVEYEWTNHTGEKFSLQALTKMAVYQNGKSIEDEDGDWNYENFDSLGNYAYFSIENNLSLSVEFTYELEDDSPIEIVFYAIEEDDKVLTIEID